MICFRALCFNTNTGSFISLTHFGNIVFRLTTIWLPGQTWPPGLYAIKHLPPRVEAKELMIHGSGLQQCAALRAATIRQV